LKITNSNFDQFAHAILFPVVLHIRKAEYSKELKNLQGFRTSILNVDGACDEEGIKLIISS
jgi:hypothetical protein